MLGWAEHCTGAELAKLIAKYRRVLRISGHIPVDDPAFRYIRRRDTPTGMVQVTAQLLPEEAAIVMEALEVARRQVAEAADVPAETSEGLGERLEAERAGEAITGNCNELSFRGTPGQQRTQRFSGLLPPPCGVEYTARPA